MFCTVHNCQENSLMLLFPGRLVPNLRSDGSAYLYFLTLASTWSGRVERSPASWAKWMSLQINLIAHRHLLTHAFFHQEGGLFYLFFSGKEPLRLLSAHVGFVFKHINTSRLKTVLQHHRKCIKMYFIVERNWIIYAVYICRYKDYGFFLKKKIQVGGRL